MTAPDPLTPADCDLRDFGFMPVDIVRLFGSEFHARASDAAWRAGVTLWLRAWHQVPAGSLPDDEIALTRLAELGRDLRTWRKIKDDALRGWIKASDGRLYHSVVAEKVTEAWDAKVRQRHRTFCATIRKHNERHKPAEIAAPSFEDWVAIGRPDKVAELVCRVPQGGDVTPKSRATDESVTSDIGSKGQGQGQGQVEYKPKPTLNHESQTSASHVHAHERPPPGITNPNDALGYVCIAAGWHPSTDTQRQNSIGIINGWLALGCSLELILDAIAKAIRRDPSPTKSLRRFDSTIRGMRQDQLGGEELPVTGADVAAVTSGVVKRLAVG